ncbi:MAG: hypothetical protein IJV66_00720 [Firmicutes bacterium]|nr:hypothetical protein [Bacillota bacterium]
MADTVVKGKKARLKVEESELIMLSPAEIGFRLSRQLKGTTCAKGYVEEGTFAKGDAAILLSGGEDSGTETEIELIEVYRGEPGDRTGYVINSGLKEHIAREGEYAFLIFDGGDALAMAGDVIVSK